MSRTRLTAKQIVVGIALIVALLHFVTGPGYRGPWPFFVRGYAQDILLPFAMYLLLGVTTVWLLGSRIARATFVIAVGAGVETLQFFGVPLFGRTFDPWDFAMYAFGAAAGVLFEIIILSRLSPSKT
jgi:hypothetical protein